MATTAMESSPALAAIGAKIFDSLWGSERNPLPTAGEHAYERIWLQVVTGERKPGERLSDTELAAKLGISRTPVREALYRLVQVELVRFDARRGFWVREFTAEDVRELYSVRGALEVLAVRLAAPRLRPDGLRAELADLAAVRAALAAEDPVARFLEHDFRLHDFLIHASRNRRLIRMLATLRSQVSLFQIRDTGYPRRMERALDDHERILLALIAGQTEQAAAHLANHIDNSRDGVLADIFNVQAEVEKGGRG